MSPPISSQQIAIVGLGCRFPGANSPAEFWQLLTQGVEAIAPPSAQRKSLLAKQHIDDTPGGFLENIDQFDPQFFDILPDEAIAMDPQQRLLLEIVWEALEDAGQVPAALAERRVGVFIGIADSRYEHLGPQGHNDDPYGLTGSNPCMAANRISYQLNFQGPSIAVNTACSSALVALHQAVGNLHSGESDLVAVGGVNLMLSSVITQKVKGAGLLSSSGHNCSFDASADGYVRSEGAGMVILKRLAEAQADGDRIYATIRGSALNHNGRGNGLIGPSPKAQKALLKQAYQQAQVSPSQVQYVEANGSGTSLGDGLELNTLGEVLSENRPSPCFIGSVKTNIGNTEVASGIAGLIKVVLSLYHRQIPPHLHFQSASDYVDLEKSRLKVPTTLIDWPGSDGAISSEVASNEDDETIRNDAGCNHIALAGISAFGLGGTNAHVVLSGMTPSHDVDHSPDKPEILILSAKSEQALKGLAHRYQRFLAASLEELSTGESHLSLRDICYTASMRRSQFSHRFTIVTESIHHLQHHLSQALQQPGPFGHKVTRRSRRQASSTIHYPKSGISPTERIATLQVLAQQWKQGSKIDWAKIYSHCHCRFITAPTYAFDRQSYWIAALSSEASAANASAASSSATSSSAVGSPSTSEPPASKKPAPFCTLSTAEFVVHPADNLTPQSHPFENIQTAERHTPVDTEFVEPRTSIEKKLANIWEDTIGVRPIGITDNFFALGGTSILAQQAFDTLKRQTGIDFPLNQLFQSPTIQDIATQLSATKYRENPKTVSRNRALGISQPPSNYTVRKTVGETTRLPSHIILLKSGQAPTNSLSNAPIFLIHAAGSSILFYQPLVQYLQTHRPIYGIQPAFEDARGNRLKSVEAMAKYYIEQIKLIQPHGPYCLGGASFGGLLAYEMAQQFTAIGEAVEHLIVFDHHTSDARHITKRYKNNWHTLRTDGWRYLQERMIKRYRYERDDFRIRLRQQRYRWRKRFGLPIKSFALVCNTYRYHVKLARKYALKNYAGNILVVRALELRGNETIVENDLGWSRHVQGNVQVVTNPGGHMTMFRTPHVADLAQKIDSVLWSSGDLPSEGLCDRSRLCHIPIL